MKETLFPELDRNSASPTESADGAKETIGNTPELTVRTAFPEKVLDEVGQYVARVKCKKRGRQRCLQGGWHRGY